MARYNNVPRVPKRVFYDWQEAIAMENHYEYLSERLHEIPCGKRNQVQGGKCAPGNLCYTCRQVGQEFFNLMAEMYPARKPDDNNRV